MRTKLPSEMVLDGEKRAAARNPTIQWQSRWNSAWQVRVRKKLRQAHADGRYSGGRDTCIYVYMNLVLCNSNYKFQNIKNHTYT